MFDGYKHHMNRNENICTVTINNVNADDCGEVECRAYNKAGNATIRANLILQGMPFIQWIV